MLTPENPQVSKNRRKLLTAMHAERRIALRASEDLGPEVIVPIFVAPSPAEERAIIRWSRRAQA